MREQENPFISEGLYRLLVPDVQKALDAPKRIDDLANEIFTVAAGTNPVEQIAAIGLWMRKLALELRDAAKIKPQVIDAVTAFANLAVSVALGEMAPRGTKQ